MGEVEAVGYDLVEREVEVPEGGVSTGEEVGPEVVGIVGEEGRLVVGAYEGLPMLVTPVAVVGEEEVAGEGDPL